MLVLAVQAAAEYTGLVVAAFVDNSVCVAAAGCLAGAVENSDCPVVEAVGQVVGSAVGRVLADAPPVDSAEWAKYSTRFRNKYKI